MRAISQSPRRASKRLTLQWHITEYCNLKCLHCYQEAARQSHCPWESLTRFETQFSSLIEDLQSSGFAPGAHINITGGEPLLHPEFFTLAEHLARQHRYSLGVLTNGTVIDTAIAQDLKSSGVAFVQVSLDGVEETHDRIRGPGSFMRAVQGLRHLINNNVRTLISFTATRNNYREFSAIASLGKRLGVSKVWCDRVVPIGGSAAESLSREETHELVQLMSQARLKSRSSHTEVSLQRALQFCQNEAGPYRCTAGSSLLAIMPNGDIYPCRRMPRCAGNLHEDSLSRIYFNSPLLQELRAPKRSDGCAACFYADTCAGGLRCLADAVYGTPFRADPGCWLAHPGGEGQATQPCHYSPEQTDYDG